MSRRQLVYKKVILFAAVQPGLIKPYAPRRLDVRRSEVRSQVSVINFGTACCNASAAKRQGGVQTVAQCCSVNPSRHHLRRAIANKLSPGTFFLRVFLQCMKALGRPTVEISLDDIDVLEK